jgi:hypothetical protein
MFLGGARGPGWQTRINAVLKAYKEAASRGNRREMDARLHRRGTSMNDADFENLWKTCPRGSPQQQLCIMTELHKIAPAKVREFDATRVTRTPNTLTRDEWRRLFQKPGATDEQVRRALGELGFGPP